MCSYLSSSRSARKVLLFRLECVPASVFLMVLLILLVRASPSVLLVPSIFAKERREGRLRGRSITVEVESRSLHQRVPVSGRGRLHSTGSDDVQSEHDEVAWEAVAWEGVARNQQCLCTIDEDDRGLKTINGIRCKHSETKWDEKTMTQQSILVHNTPYKY
jgi:hypothetical protein